MSTRISFSVRSGPLAGKSWSFDSHDTCLIGRHAECAIQLPDDAAHKTVSRHHALIEIAPPLARIRDFGSLNGTFLNGDKIGARDANIHVRDAANLQFPERELRHGDQIRVGDTLLLVAIQNVAPPVAPSAPRVTPQPSPRVGSPSPVPPAIATGKISDYKIERELGRGGMGQVFLARRKSTGKQVALKVMLPNVAVDERAKAIFEREIALTRSLSHPNVVSMLDSGTDGDKFFFTLDFCDQGSVMDWMEKNDSFPSPSQAVALSLQVLDGLDYLSRVPLRVQLQDGTEQLVNGMVHRDLSPQNILLRTEGDGLSVKISDVGLGKAFDTAGLSGLTMTGGGAAGKPVFMPRQQVINYKFAKPEVDVWAAAATLYFLLTGEFPRDFPPRVDPFKVVLSTDPIPIRQRDPKIPAPLAQVIDRALQDKPALHYKQARDLSADLMAALGKIGGGA